MVISKFQKQEKQQQMEYSAISPQMRLSLHYQSSKITINREDIKEKGENKFGFCHGKDLLAFLDE